MVHTEYQVNHKTQPFCVKVVHLVVTNVQTLAGHDVGAIRLAPTTTLHFNQPLKTKYSVPHWIWIGWRQRHAQLGFEHWVLDGPP